MWNAGAVSRLFDGEVHVSYHQAHVLVGDAEPPGLTAAFAGQVNGLCGAAESDALFLNTGLHSGWVPLTVEVSTVEPPVADDWDDVVEVSFATSEPEVVLMGWAGGSVDRIRLGPPGWYRVRYCAHGTDAGRDQDTRLDGEPAPDRYLLQFWPSPPAADTVVRQGSTMAAYWHEFARGLPPPPTPAERAAAERAEADRVRDERATAAARFEQRRWGGRAPSERLRALGGNVLGVAGTNRDLLDDFEALEPGTQRAAARWLAHRAFERAELDGLPWVGPALDALDRGEPLPAPFTSHAEAAARVRGAGPHRTQVVAALTDPRRHEPPRRIHRPSFAVPALFSATDADPLRALVDTFSHAAATFDDERETLIAELRARFLQ